MRRRRRSYLFNGDTYGKEKGHLFQMKRGHRLKLKVRLSELKKGTY